MERRWQNKANKKENQRTNNNNNNNNKLKSQKLKVFLKVTSDDLAGARRRTEDKKSDVVRWENAKGWESGEGESG